MAAPLHLPLVVGVGGVLTCPRVSPLGWHAQFSERARVLVSMEMGHTSRLVEFWSLAPVTPEEVSIGDLKALGICCMLLYKDRAACRD